MAAHPFGPIENQLIVGYYKRGFDPRRLVCVVQTKVVKVPNHRANPVHYLLRPVFYGWSPANGNSSSHDLGPNIRYDEILSTSELLSRGLGYRITFTMPEQEIRTEDPTSWPQGELEILNLSTDLLSGPISLTSEPLSKNPYIKRIFLHLTSQYAPFKTLSFVVIGEDITIHKDGSLQNSVSPSGPVLPEAVNYQHRAMNFGLHGRRWLALLVAELLKTSINSEKQPTKHPSDASYASASKDPTLLQDKKVMVLDILKAEKLARPPLAESHTAFSESFAFTMFLDQDLRFTKVENVGYGRFYCFEWNRGSIVTYHPHVQHTQERLGSRYYLDLSSNRLSSELPSWGGSYWYDIDLYHGHPRTKQVFHAGFERAKSDSDHQTCQEALRLTRCRIEGGFLQTCGDFANLPDVWTIRLGCFLIPDDHNLAGVPSQVFQIQAVGRHFKFNWRTNRDGKVYSYVYTPGWALWAFVYWKGKFQAAGRKNHISGSPILLDMHNCDYYDANGIGIICCPFNSPKASDCGYFDIHRLGLIIYRGN